MNDLAHETQNDATVTVKPLRTTKAVSIVKRLRDLNVSVVDTRTIIRTSERYFQVHIACPDTAVTPREETDYAVWVRQLLRRMGYRRFVVKVIFCGEYSRSTIEVEFDVRPKTG